MRLVRKEKSSGTWGITCSSRGDDNENFILLWLGSVVYTYYFDWFFLKPYTYEWTYNGTTHKDMIAARELGFTISLGEYDGYISIRYGADKDFLMTNRKDNSNIKHITTFRRMWSIPWMHSTFREHALLNMDGTVFVVVDRKCNLGNVGENPWDYTGHERMKFTFYDGYDGDVITATIYRERRTWTKGESWMSWLRYLTKPIVSDSISLDYNKEVGRGKGSYKGGITGQGTEVKKGESVLGTCMRFCSEAGHTFIDFEKDLSGHRVYKNVHIERKPIEAKGQGGVL